MLPDLPYQGTIKLYGTGTHIPNQDTHFEHTCAPTDQEETFPYKDYYILRPSRKIYHF